MKMIKNIGFVIVTAMVIACAWLFVSGGTAKQPAAGPYLTTAPYFPEALDFAGEDVPLEQPEIYERLDRELISNTYYHSNTILTLKRAHKYFPIIENILAENGVPDDFKYLCVIESNLDNVVSPARAAGFWQFLASTGKVYGLEINSEVDERYQLEKATLAACKYLKEAHAKFNSWTMAAASYNMGMAGLNSKSIEQRQKNYYDLLLYKETQRYVFRILAIKSIFSQPDRFGFYILDQEKYTMPKHYSIEKTGSITCMVCFAEENGMTYKELKWMNPWIRSKAIRNKSGKTYKVKVLEK